MIVFVDNYDTKLHHVNEKVWLNFLQVTAGLCDLSSIKHKTMALKFVLLIAGCLSLTVSLELADMPSVKLQNAAVEGMTMPIVGLGTGAYVYVPNTIPGEIWNDTVAEQAVKEWIKLGGRRIDASLSYRNAKGVGKAIAESGVSRKDLFIVSKVGSGGLVSGGGMGYNETMAQIKPTFDELGIDYLDLLLIHWPGPPAVTPVIQPA